MEQNANHPTSEIVNFRNITEWSKEELTRLGVALVNETEETGEDTGKLLAFAAKIKHYASAIETAAKDAAYRQVKQYGPKGYMTGGVHLVTAETGTTYDYSLDPVWQWLAASVKECNDDLKAHEKVLKALPPSGMGLTHPETGETYHAYPPSVTSKPSVKVTIK